jgi:predicted Rossmann fold flavoprotein
MAFFESCGVALKTERGARVFPQSDKSSDIVDALAGFAKRAGAVYVNSRVTAVDADESGVRGVVLADSSRLGAPAVLLATGGLSYPATGSTGDGYSLAAALGHTVVSPSASIVPIETVQDWCGGLMGLSLKNVTLRVEKDAKTVFSELGELMFTHFGLSGPLVLSASARLEGDIFPLPALYRHKARTERGTA